MTTRLDNFSILNFFELGNFFFFFRKKKIIVFCLTWIKIQN